MNAPADTATLPSELQKPQNTTVARLAAVRVVSAVIKQQRSLSDCLPPALAELNPRERGLCQELSYGVLRWYVALNYLLARLLAKPLATKEHQLQTLLLVGLYQLQHTRIPAYAAIASSVDCARALGKPWASKLVNAVLRNFQRRQTELLADLAQQPLPASAHPAWLLEQIQHDWPNDWQAIIDANNQPAALTLRVNRLRLSRADYLRQLAAAGLEATAAAYTETGVNLTHAVNVDALPGFHQGLVSVQDNAGQLAAGLMQLSPGLRVLDACAAPGGKTAHLLETEPDIALWAIDKDPDRLKKVRENLTRLDLGHNAQLLAVDASTPQAWWDGHAFDRILLDAPCSGGGVIRRHPDIKHLRRQGDSEQLAAVQQQLLRQLWPLLRPGGLLLYATCAINRRENQQVVADFVADHSSVNVEIAAIAADWGRSSGWGRQILPGEAAMDGFFYACLHKHA